MEFQDYRGEFNPDLKIEDLSKTAIASLLELCQRDFIGQDAIWYTAVKDRFGVDAAREISEAIWANKGAQTVRDDIRRVLPAFGIEGSDIATMFKYLQVSPCAGMYFYNFRFELRDKNHGVVTVVRCPSLEYFEKHGQTEVAEWSCGIVDPGWIQEVASYFNPKIKVKSTREGARKSPDDFPCQFEVTLEE